MPKGSSDHPPCFGQNLRCRMDGPRPFRYCDMWRTHPEYLQIVRDVWKISIYGRPMFILVKKLKQVKLSLRRLYRQKFSNLQERIKEAHLKLIEAEDELSDNQFDAEYIEAMTGNKEEYLALVRVDLNLAAQRAKVDCISEMDSNTQYLHAKVRDNTHRGKVVALQNEVEEMTTDREYI